MSQFDLCWQEQHSLSVPHTASIQSLIESLRAVVVTWQRAMGHKMRKWLSNPKFWGTAAAASFVLHAWWAWSTHEGIQVARCGAAWVVFAGAIIARPIIRMGGYDAWYQSTRTIDLGTMESLPEQIEDNRQSELDARCVQWYGPTLAVLGTILWAYGDMGANAVIKGLCSLGLSN